ncbi:hypothetical protein AWB68_06697 [Caballeronia choica]|uniref:Uncharacterized protein n=1 Tax=Caballeronia choica TaxID=326476 RepID=A0A158KR39_9BURK|nr:hypothetical protein AWB68_06697 [Caballeronia choica]
MPEWHHITDLTQAYLKRFFGADARQLRFWSGS